MNYRHEIQRNLKQNSPNLKYSKKNKYVNPCQWLLRMFPEVYF